MGTAAPDKRQSTPNWVMLLSLRAPNPTYSDTLNSSLICYQIGFVAAWQERRVPTEGNEKQGGKGAVFPPCVDLNDLTAITPKQKLEDKGCGERAHRLTLHFPERTFSSPRRATSMLLRTRCVRVNMLPGATNSCFFYMIKSISAGMPRILYVASLSMWPRVPLL